MQKRLQNQPQIQNRKNMKKIVSVLTTLFLLTGCGGGGGSSNQENSGELPKLDRTASLEGVDSNGNGIRDDIEEYITKKYSDKQERRALMQFAKAEQKTLLVDVSDMIAVKKVSIEGNRALVCVLRTFEKQSETGAGSIAWREISSMTTNTKARLQAYLKYNHALDGTASSSPEGDTCE